MLERGDPDRNRILFKNVAEELKKIFKQDTAALGIENNLRDFAITWCGHMQKMLKSVKKEYGEYAENYSFNYLYKPRPKKADSAAASSVAVAAAAAVSLGVDVAMTTEGKAANQADDLSPTSVAHVPGVKGGTGRPKVDEDGDDEPKPWEEEGWVPRTKAGKQKSPNVIRGELQRYIDKCKADGTMTQTKIIEKMGVNNNTYRRFMDPKRTKTSRAAFRMVLIGQVLGYMKKQDTKKKRQRKLVEVVQSARQQPRVKLLHQKRAKRIRPRS